MRTLSTEIATILLLAAFLESCAGNTQVQAPNVLIADEAMVSGCRYLDNVHGSSGLYGVFAQRGFANAREDVLSQAREIGATHLVLVPTVQGYRSEEHTAELPVTNGYRVCRLLL